MRGGVGAHPNAAKEPDGSFVAATWEPSLGTEIACALQPAETRPVQHSMKHVTTKAILSLVTLLAVTTSCGKEAAASGRSGTRLALTAPSNQRLAQGQSNKVTITVERTGFADAVQISFSNLPSGVRVEGDSIPAGEASKEFVLVAEPTAALVEKAIVTVAAKGSGITTSQTFEVSVKAKS